MNTKIETGLWHIEWYLMQRYGVDTAKRDMDPIKWYIYTGRASVDVTNRLLCAKPFMVGRLLHKGGSYDEIIRRVLSYIGIETE